MIIHHPFFVLSTLPYTNKNVQADFEINISPRAHLSRNTFALKHCIFLNITSHVRMTPEMMHLDFHVAFLLQNHVIVTKKSLPTRIRLGGYLPT